MITAVDTNVLLDVFGADSTFGLRSKEALRVAISQGRLIACEAVWSEVSGFFPNAPEARRAMERLGVEFSASTIEAALDAGAAWKAFRQRGGKRMRVAADFLIGAHALHHSDRLLTRDRGFYRSCFNRLTILDPTRK